MRRSMRILTIIAIVFVVFLLCFVGAFVIVAWHQSGKPALVGQVLPNVTILDPDGKPKNDLSVYDKDTIVVSDECEAVLDAGYKYRFSPGSRVSCYWPSAYLTIYLERGTLKVEGAKRDDGRGYDGRISTRDTNYIPVGPGLTVQVTDKGTLIKAGTEAAELQEEKITLQPGQSYFVPIQGSATTIPSQPTTRTLDKESPADTK